MGATPEIYDEVGVAPGASARLQRPRTEIRLCLDIAVLLAFCCSAACTSLVTYRSKQLLENEVTA